MRILIVATIITAVLSLWCLVSVSWVPGMLRKLGRLVSAVMCGSLSVLLGAFLVCLHAFHVFSGETLIAHVTTQRLTGDQFELTYQPVGAELSPPLHVRLRGDQWAISGGIVKWHPWLSEFGFATYHNPLRLSGQFSNLEQQRAQPVTVYPLQPFEDTVWELLYRFAPHLPFIEAVYGSSAYVYVEPSVTQDIYVTTFGYLIKRRDRQ